MARTQGLHPLGPFKPMCDVSQGIFCLSPPLFSSAGLRSLQFGLSDTNPLFRVNKIIASLEPQRGCDCKESCDCQPRQEVSEYYWLGQWAVRGPLMAFCSASPRVTAGPLLIDIWSLRYFFVIRNILHKYYYVKTPACVKVFKEVSFKYLLLKLFLIMFVFLWVPLRGPQCWCPGPGITHSSQLSGSTGINSAGAECAPNN